MEWEAFKMTIGIMRIRSLDANINHILGQESRLASKSNEDALFVTKREAGKRGKDGKPIKTEGKGDKSKKDRTKCTHCRRTGHVPDKCWKLHPELKTAMEVAKVAQESEDEYLVLATDSIEEETMLSASSSDTWACDSGTSSHICNIRQLFVDLKAASKRAALCMTGREKLGIEGRGSVRLELASGKVMLSDVLYVPNCSGNLFSIRQLHSKRIKMTITGGSLRAELANGQVLFNVESCRGLYMLDVAPVAYKIFEDYKDISQFRNYQGIKELVANKNILLWHARLGHVSLPKIKAIANLGKIQLRDRSPDICMCEACLLGKKDRCTHKHVAIKKEPTEYSPLQLIHTDVAGPLPPSNGGNNYMVTYTEHVSRYTVLDFLALKLDVPKTLKKYVEHAENYRKLKISYIRSDNEGEYTSAMVHSYFEGKGIVHQKIAPYTPQRNGVAERMNETIFQITRSLLKHAGLPERYWPDAALYAAYVKNRLPNKDGITPFELWTGSAPSYDHIRTFGCLTYAVVPSELRKKVDDKTCRCILLGYSEETGSQYHVLDLVTKRILTTMDARFDESVLNKDIMGAGKNMALLDRVIKMETQVKSGTPDVKMEEADEEITVQPYRQSSSIWEYSSKNRYYGESWMIIIIIIMFHSVCNLNGYDSRNITITFFPNLFQRLSIPKRA
jgi:hypothetical protein